MTTRSPSHLPPDRATLAAFAGVVLLGGANFVGVRFSNQELPPFYGAGLRFAAAALLLLGLVAVRRIPLPRGEALVGTVLYGILGFTAFYALAYWALQELPAGVGGLVFASVPLLTLFLAVAHRLEGFRWRGLAGGMLTLTGIAVLLNAPLSGRLPLGSMLAMVGAAICAAEAGVVIKRFPPSHPVATNGLAMTIGSLLLLLISRFFREPWSLPSQGATRLAVLYLVFLGSVALFGLYLFVLKRWTASGASYQFVLMPVVAVLLGAWLAGEPVTTGVVAGGVIVLGGVYLGAFSGRRASAPAAPEQELVG